MAGKPALISPYVGGKGGPRYQLTVAGHTVSRICDRAHFYDVGLSCFAGSLAEGFQHDHGITHWIAADIDPGVRAVAAAWNNSEDRKAVNGLIEFWKARVLDAPDQTFEYLSERISNGYFCEGIPSIAAIYLITKRLVFNSVLRCNKKGGLNVALSQDKLTKFLASGREKSKRCPHTLSLIDGDDSSKGFWGWQYQWPDNGIKTLTFEHSWQDAVKALADSDHERALVVIDPPYFSDKEWVEVRHDGRKVASKMIPAYAGHNPQSVDELALCIDCLDAVLETGKAARVVVFNYHSDRLEDAINELYGKHGFSVPCFASNLGPLGNMNNAQKFHGRDDEWVWEIGGKRMFQDHDACTQTNLLELAESV